MDADQAELAEIDENLIRADLTPAEEAIHIGRRKAIYEKLHPETVHGAVGRRGKRSQHATSFEPTDAFIDSAWVRDGGLLSYGPDMRDIFRRAALYVDRILRGEKPADLPVQLPTKFEMAVNAKAAKALGLTVPPTLLAIADQVIE
jgi:hypothetical protein